MYAVVGEGMPPVKRWRNAPGGGMSPVEEFPRWRNAQWKKAYTVEECPIEVCCHHVSFLSPCRLFFHRVG